MNLSVVLVRTEYSTNIGSVARAMANMGGERLILVDPKCEINSKARQMAAGAQDQIGRVIVYPNWKDFFAAEGDGVRIAMTRRGGRRRKLTPLSEELARLEAGAAPRIYFIFGPESDGLDGEDLAFVNLTCHLPVFGEFASFNLAQAVLLALFIARQSFPPSALPVQTTGACEPPVQPFYFPDALIREWLEAMGFDVSARRSSAYRTLRRLFLQNQPTRHEIQVLDAILQQNIRKLKGSLGPGAEELADDVGDVSGQQLV